MVIGPSGRAQMRAVDPYFRAARSQSSRSTGMARAWLCGPVRRSGIGIHVNTGFELDLSLDLRLPLILLVEAGRADRIQHILRAFAWRNSLP